MSDWRDIESAPKDWWYIKVGWWVNGVLEFTTISCWQKQLDGWLGPYGVWQPTPTHWMPLPEPPENPE